MIRLKRDSKLKALDPWHSKQVRHPVRMCQNSTSHHIYGPRYTGTQLTRESLKQDLFRVPLLKKSKYLSTSNKTIPVKCVSMYSPPI